MVTVDKNTLFALCINNTDCDDLEKSKAYPVLPDSKAEKEGFLRVIDESGEDYLYPAACFIPLDIPLAAREALLVATK